MDNQSEWKEVSKSEIENRMKGTNLMGSALLSNFDILVKHMGYSPEEAEKAIARLKMQKLEDLKLEIIANNPYVGAGGITIPDDDFKAEKNCDPLYQEEWKQAKKCEPKQMGITGVMTFYFNVGSLAPAKAEAFVERYKEKLNKEGFLDRLKSQGVEVLFMPVRPPQESCVDYIKL